MADLNSFIGAVNQYIRAQDGVQLGKSLQLPLSQKTIPKIYSQLAQRTKAMNIMTYCSSNISDSNTAIVVGNMLRALVGICDGKLSEAYSCELEAYNSILNCYREETSNWMSPVLMIISNDLRLLAIQVPLISFFFSSH